jgi:dienelactone hydrolase
MGFSLGGALSLATTGLSPQLVDAGVVFYGTAPASLKVSPELLARPLQLHFAEEDSMKGE